ncbi:carboxylesterase/lipase family protein [Sphingomonas flavalba]|uniref:carboxylesterase/lipase family protein n=1 Tax=Sphingomonas flavalba TaxID=2559804 RepID=UPI0039E01423
MDDRHAPTVTRRTLLGGAVTALGAASALGTPTGARAAPASPGAGAILSGAGQSVVKTTAGLVQGYARDGIHRFKGVPYGDDTGGANRFMPPAPPKPWSGIRSSLSYGLVAPQDKGNGRLSDEHAFIFQWNDSVEGEYCLRVNVWTPGLDGRQRPVMVWLHGGGFAAGSGNDLPAFDGHNLARRGDVVVVTLNHRLNLLGFLDLSGIDPAFARSGNVGMLDIVAALEWVRDNIAGFGGDPGRVTIFGQSGGGAKVSTLMAMPAARGLFHRAIVQSGSFSSAQTPERSRHLADLMMRELGVAAGDVRRLQTLPYAQLRAAGEAALRRANPPADGGFDPRRRPRFGFGPVADGSVLPSAPFAPDAPSVSAAVPMIVGTTLNEFETGIARPDFEAMTEATLAERAEHSYPGRGAAVVAAFRAAAPGAKPCDIWSRIATAPVRRAAIDQTAAKARQGGAPAWNYLFTRTPPLLDGRPRAYHCAEIPFVFANANRCPTMTGGGAPAAALEAIMADAWIAFAQSGNPNHPGMPRWDPVSTTAHATMIFDDHTRQEIAPDAAEQAALA